MTVARTLMYDSRYVLLHHKYSCITIVPIQYHTHIFLSLSFSFFLPSLLCLSALSPYSVCVARACRIVMLQKHFNTKPELPHCIDGQVGFFFPIALSELSEAPL